MKQRTRYFFILFGFLVFGIISPLIVLYVSGFSYDWRTDQVTSTGLLSIKTEPSKAIIFLDGEKVDTAPATIRFLKPKEYNITIRKEEYFDWTKKLEIKSGKVTWVSDRLPELHMIRKDPAPVIVAGKVKDFFAGNSFALYLTEAELIKTDLGESATTQSVKLPDVCEKITVSPSQSFILLSCNKNNYIYNQNELTLLPHLFPAKTNYIFGPENSLYSLEETVLIKTDPETGARQQIASNAIAFGFQTNSIYQLQNIGNGDSRKQILVSSPLYNPDQTQTLIENLPVLDNPQIFIARTKEIFLLGNETLYRVNEKLEPLLTGVKEIGFDSETPALTYTTGFELYSYDFTRGKGQLIVRHTGIIKQPQGKTDIGYVLYQNENKLQASEVDSRDHVNNYTLNTGSDIKKYETDPSHTLIYFLDSDTLKFFRIR